MNEIIKELVDKKRDEVIKIIVDRKKELEFNIENVKNKMKKYEPGGIFYDICTDRHTMLLLLLDEINDLIIKIDKIR